MTPIQQAIANLKKRIELSGSHTYDEITKEHIHILESLLPKEKEFAEYVWMQGVATGYQSGKHGFSNKPTLPEFLNQLYPES